MPSGPLAPFLSVLLAGPPASLLPARAPRARPLRPAPLRSELEPVAAAPGFPQCTARRSSHPIPSARVRPPLPRRRALTPTPRLSTRGPSALCSLNVGGSVLRLHRGPGIWRSALSHPAPTPMQGPPEPGARPAQRCPGRAAPLVRVSACVSRVTLIERLLCAWPQRATFAASSPEAVPLTQEGRHRCCYQRALFLPNECRPPAHLGVPGCL